MPHLDAFVRVAANLPAMPEVAHKLLKSFDRDDLSLRELASLVSHDTTLAAKVLRTANSARYSPTHEIATLNDAAATLGMASMRDLTLASCLTGALPTTPGFDRLTFWRRTLSVASYAATLAKSLAADEEAAYVSGLMLRTGQVLMAMVDPVAFQHVNGLTEYVDGRFNAEQAAFGLVHTQVTAELARRWQFPAAMVTAFQAAGEPLAARPFDRAGAVLRLASVITDCRELGVPWRQGLMDTQADLVARLALDLEWVDAHLAAHAVATAGVDALLQ